MEQTTMFTIEQMKGTGQSNILDLIERNKRRIKELRQTPHTFWNDPGHGWLEVEYQDLIVLDLLGKISGYSYRKGDKVYLEEDLDAVTYIKALFYGKCEGYEYEQWKAILNDVHKENIFIRNLNHYR
jgi:hypothetical protein